MPLAAFVALCIVGCPSRAKPGDDDVVTVGGGDNPDSKGKLGQVEFAGPADTEVNLRDASGKIVYTGLMPFSVRLPAGAYTWSARFVDSQRTDERSLSVMPGDDARVDVAPPSGGVPTDDTEGAKNAPLGEKKTDFNKPWMTTEPLIPTGPGAGIGSQKAGATKGETPKEGTPAAGATGTEGPGPPAESGGAASRARAGTPKPGSGAKTSTEP